MKPVQVPSFMSIDTTVIELREFEEKKKKKKKNMDKLGKIFLALIWRGSGIHSTTDAVAVPYVLIAVQSHPHLILYIPRLSPS